MNLSQTVNALLIAALLLLVGCGEPGRVRVSEQELSGTYVTDIQLVASTPNGPVVRNIGKEQLTLYADRTYLQSFSSPTRQFTNRGSWKSSNHIFGGTEVKLVGANLSEGDASDSSSKRGVLYLEVHRENGKLKLARNESADWYYNRVQ
jgi:hypothetical protein